MKDNELSAIEQIIERYPWYSAAHLELYKRLSELGEEQREAYLYKAAAYLYSRESLYDIAFNVVPEVAVSETPVETSEETSVDVEKEKELRELKELREKEREQREKEREQRELKELRAERAEREQRELREKERELREQRELKELRELREKEREKLLKSEKKELVPEKSKPAAIKEGDFEFIFDIDEDKEVIHRVVMSGGDYFSRTDFDTIELDEELPLDRFIVEKPSLLRSSLASREGLTATDEVEIDSSEVFEDSGFYTETLAKIYTSQGFYKRALDVYAKLILLYPEKSAYFATLVKELKTKHNT